MQKTNQLHLPLITKENVEELSMLTDDSIVKVEIPKFKDHSRNTSIFEDSHDDCEVVTIPQQ